MFTKFDTVDYQQVLMNYIEWSYDDVMIQYFSVKNKPFQLVSTITPLYIMGPWWNLVGLMVDGEWRTREYDVISDVSGCWVMHARYLMREWNILFQTQQLHIAEGLRRSYNDSGFILALLQL